MKKKLILIAAMICVMAMAMSIACFAAEEINGVYYDLDSKTQTAYVAEKNRYDCKLETVVIPEYVTFNDVEYKIVGIRNSAFENNANLVNMVIMPKLDVIPNWFIKNCANVKAVFVDLSEATSIGIMAFNLYSGYDTNVVEGREFWFYEPSSYDAEHPENWVMVKEFDLSKLTNLGDSAFHNANLDKVKIGKTKIGSQTFRFAKLKEVEVEAEDVPYYFCGHNFYLEKITIKGAKTVGSCAFTSCKSVKEIYIDFSQITKVDSGAFILNDRYDGGQTRTQWYNLEGEKVVDLSSLTHIGDSAFASSNIGSAKIAWPKELKTVSDQMFRKCNITQPIYLNGAEGANLRLQFWAFESNSFPIVIIGNGISTVDAKFTALTEIVVLSENVKFTNDTICTVSGSKIYYKSLSEDSRKPNSSIELIPITSGTASNYGFCGIVANVTTESGDVTVGSVEHTISSAIDNAFCPSGKVLVTQCAYCDYITYTVDGTEVENKPHNFDLENGAVFNGTQYVNFYEKGYIIVKCRDCEAKQLEKEANANPIFTFLGISRSEKPDAKGKYSIVQGFKLDKKAYEDYICNGTNELSFGFVVGSAEIIGTSPLLTDNLTVIAKNPEKTIIAGSNFFKHEIITVKVSGISEEMFEKELILALYVTDFNNIYYLSDGVQSTTAPVVTFAQ